MDPTPEERRCGQCEQQQATCQQTAEPTAFISTAFATATTVSAFPAIWWSTEPVAVVSAEQFATELAA
jgi:hypothetical protein